MERTTIMLPASLKKSILRQTRTRHISLGQFLRSAAENYLQRGARHQEKDPLAGGDYIIEKDAPPMFPKTSTGTCTA